MKLSSLLLEYLLINRRLDLPGMGTFRLSEIPLDEKINSKPSRPESLNEVIFENKPSIHDTPELISFLSGRTGKMKPLAAADLNSHLDLAKEFLNIGKPFLFEGIGSLSKLSTGEYSFIAENFKDNISKEIKTTSGTEDSFTGYGDVLHPVPAKNFRKKIAVVLLLLAGMTIAVWLGYKVYLNSASENLLAPQEKTQTTIPEAGNIVLRKDSLQASPDPQQQDGVKYIVEIARRNRALDRYARLKSYGWDLHMETADSMEFKLFLLLHTPVSDTTRILDSLTVLNGRRVFIEN